MQERTTCSTASCTNTGVPEQALVNVFYDRIGVIIGASGAVFGILLAFGMMFPNVQLMLLFPPIPIRPSTS